jgi:DNA replication and repair protein RecF
LHVDAYFVVNVFVERLTLNAFRNYQQLDIDLKDYRRVALIGANAQGKSSFLEAIYALAFAGSFRSHQIQDLIHWEEDATRISTHCVYQRGDSFSLGFEIRRNGKRLVQVNQVYQKRLVDYIGLLKLVFFSQQDLELVRGQPAYRRSYLDMLMIQLRSSYYLLLQSFQRTLKQRNTVLRAMKMGTISYKQGMETLDLWDIPFSEVLAKIVNQRRAVVQQLSERIVQAHIAISGLSEVIEIIYKPSLTADNTEDILKVLQQRRSQDIARGQTQTGPHRDDILLRLGKHDLKHFGSQGQIRTAALALKLGELSYLASCLGEQMLVEQISQHNLQVFMTTTHLEPVVARLLEKDGLVIHVSQGKINC